MYTTPCISLKPFTLTYVILLFRNFDMKLLKRNNYPAYTLDDADTIILKDDNGNPVMISHKFDQMELGATYQ